jgi:LPS export ABC transporter protein LptC
MFFFIPLLLLFFSCENDIEEVKKITQEYLAIEKGKEVEILFSENGIPTIRITAPTAVRYKGIPPEIPYTEFPDGLSLLVYNKAGELESELTADNGKMNDESDDLSVKGNVIINNVKGEKLNTEELTWNKVDKKIRSEGFVKIFTDDEVIYGTGFEADENFTNYIIYNISGVVKVKDGEF